MTASPSSPSLPASPASEPTFLTLHEIVQKARQKLNHDSWDYIVGGTETETTVRRNRAAIDKLGFRPRILRDVSQIDTGIQFLGQQLRLPLLLAPVGSLELFAPDSAIAAARAAERFGIGHMLSSVCQVDFKQVAQAVPGALRLYQLYVHGDSSWVDERVDQVQQAGCKAFCLTVDSAYYSRRERDLAKRNIRRSNVPGRHYQAGLTWQDVLRVKSRLHVPLILKGVATAEDAKLAIEHGVDMVYVSNHGGRQLDHDRGTMDVLPEVVDAVSGRARIIVDGGFNRGTDIVKAIAMGADLVGLGRMQCYGLAAAGEDGVVRMLELLETEIRTTMGLLGVTRLSDLDHRYVTHVDPTHTSSVLSAFPHLSLDERSFY